MLGIEKTVKQFTKGDAALMLETLAERQRKLQIKQSVSPTVQNEKQKVVEKREVKKIYTWIY